ncbi:MAG: cbb3-type cytochrome c oxidase subunit II [Verrucomicrobia bacterium]|nr:cbb3-type cytochrome c oxidase subunit II [Verrucomicrobiota bacterium]
MNHGPLIFLGLLFTMASSWCGLVLAPQLQLGNQQPVAKGSTSYPPNRPGLANQGREIYRANGCFYCHSQQVGPRDSSSDITRGWGKRHSVAQDYINDLPVMLGSRRLGPDLMNVGVRRAEDETGTNLVWHLQHLYNPQITSPGSIMPSYPYLFEKRQLSRGQAHTAEALPLSGRFAPPEGIEIVPKPEAFALVHYLFSLQSAEVALFEAPLPVPPPPVGDTNAAPAGATNSAAK